MSTKFSFDNTSDKNEPIGNEINTDSDYDENFYGNDSENGTDDELFDLKDIENLGIDFDNDRTEEYEKYDSEDLSKVKKIKQKEERKRRLKEKEESGESEALTKFFVVLFSAILIAITLYGVVYFATKAGEQLSTTENVITKQYE